MSKAVAGAAMLGVDAAMLAGLVLMPVASPLLATLFNTLAMPLLAGGISMEAGAIAQALGSNTGMGVTTRQAAGYRQIIRGVQRVGGTTVFCSTGFADRKYYNMVIALTSHPCEAIEAVYLDGRKVYFNTSSTYNQTVNGI